MASLRCSQSLRCPWALSTVALLEESTVGGASRTSDLCVGHKVDRVLITGAAALVAIRTDLHFLFQYALLACSRLVKSAEVPLSLVLTLLSEH